ncbi:hypothetical protein FRC01_004385 [Tulasnella sp. 417]|nr:hypothetical protein FRC01_004385 [Tulasnella sp. 417]
MSGMVATAIWYRGFVLDTEENEASSSKGAPSSDDAPTSNDNATSPAQGNDPPASPASPVAAPAVLVTATPALGSNVIEIPDSQANTTDTDTEEEDEADARFVDCSLELISPTTRTNLERFDDGPSSSKGSLKRLPSQQALAAATPSPMSTSFSSRKRFFLEAVKVPSLMSLNAVPQLLGTVHFLRPRYSSKRSAVLTLKHALPKLVKSSNLAAPAQITYIRALRGSLDPLVLSASGPPSTVGAAQSNSFGARNEAR